MAFGVRKTGFKLFLEQYLNDLQSDLDVVLSEVMCHNAKIFCSALWRVSNTKIIMKYQDFMEELYFTGPA